MANTSQVIERWVRDVGTSDPRFYSDRSTNIMQDSRQIYSYGSHFPMARLIGDRYDGGWFLVNGDLYSVSTSRHQGDLRAAIARSGLKSLIVPFSALREAGVELDSIEWIEVTDDTYETRVQTWDRWEDLPRHLKYRTKTETGIGYRTEDCKHLTHGDVPSSTWEDEDGQLLYWSWEDHKMVERRVDPGECRGTLHFTPYTTYDYYEVKTEPGENGLWRKETRVHHLGQAVFRARYQSGTEKKRHWSMRTDREAWFAAVDRGEDVTRDQFKRRYYWTENKPVYDTAYFLSGYDENERGRTGQGLYFLAQLPADSEPMSVEEAFECLKPRQVKVAESYDMDVIRQGDVFGIAVEFTTRELKEQGAVRPPLTEIEQGWVTTMRKRGEDVARIKGMGKTENWVLGVNHTGTDVMLLPDGTTLARGTLRHKRIAHTWQGVFAGMPEHKRVKLGDGKTWYRVVKNTVPVIGGQSRAWTVGGGVD